jgi:tetratricopeptide (TPR) repeat protein
MSDALRTSPANAAPLSDADREARIEALLLTGLDHYFSGQYEQAIDVWTRVAFLERRHGRARAYIERARSALAERQRESEELLHGGIAAYEAGDLDAARDLLTRAVADGTAGDAALVFLQRLQRAETAADALHRGATPSSPTAAAAARSTNWILTLGASAAIVLTILLLTRPVTSWLAELPLDVPADVSHQEPLPVVRSSQMVVARARTLAAEGRLRDALRLLRRVGTADPSREDADRLRADIQRDLLAAVPPTAVAPERSR